MCILCVIQKWSRKVATMLPWLVIPLIGLWLLSQFLPPAFRFEITSPRLACVLVLLVTLFWYEVLMPQLSSWRVRRNARIKERKMLEAIEMQKLRKNAVRKCRNCKTPYRDQNPCGGKFNCCYCGHKSKRPEMDQLCVASDLGRFSSSGLLRNLVGKIWSDNNWICGQDWLENGGNWVNGSFSGKSSYLKKKNSGGLFGNDYFFSFLLVFVCKSLAAILLGIMWIFGRLFRFSFDEGDAAMGSDINGLSKKGENGVNCNETKSEKARRKAEEKRQARLEREQLEEEERKQREEVARLVEERRKLRDETDNKYNKKAFKASPRDNKDKKEAERKRQERKKEWDRGSSRSNSDVDELEKRANKEIKKNKKGEVDREHNRSKGSMADSYYKGSVGARYLDRMRGNFFPSSKTLTGGGFFGKGVNANANASNTREHRSNVSLDHSNKKDFVQPERAYGKSNAHADDKNQNRLARFEPLPCPPPKKSWHQLFSRSSPIASSTDTNVLSKPNGNSQTEAQSSIASGYPVSQGYDIPATEGLPYHLPNYSYGNTTTSSTGLQSSSIVTEHENFEDPCYVPDPVLSAGPVSEPLDSFPVDFGFLADVGFEKPSPIASPVSRPRSDSSFSPSPQRTQENTNLPMEDCGAAIEKGWQAWNSCRYMSDIGANTKWDLPQKSSAPMLKEEDYVLSSTTNLMHANSDDSWKFRTSYGSISSSKNHLPMNLHGGVTRNKLVYGIPNGSAINHQFQPYHGVVWAKKEKVVCRVPVEGIESIPTIIGPRGGLYPPLHVQPVWSYE
uniref:uncharacterized protein LOC122594349 n=1 Tax=Erigeron canadensis TaxID=72917 RepID=UPI001CB8BFDD|nr:uncharacterized protein LOC122594349 [Erigeron canadensis]